MLGPASEMYTDPVAVKVTRRNSCISEMPWMMMIMMTTTTAVPSIGQAKNSVVNKLQAPDCCNIT